MHRVEQLAAQLRAELAQLEPGTFSPEHAARLTEDLALTENGCGAAKVRLAARAAECGVHRERGHADASEWVAALSGSTSSEARRELDAVAAVGQCPDTRDALVRGEVSLAQAGEIARTDAAVPGTEHELLALARNGTLGSVRTAARKRRVAAIDPEVLYAKQRQAREFKHWRDDLGMVCGSFALTPDVGIPLVTRIATDTDRLRRAAKRSRHAVESRAAYAADALVAIARGTAKTKAGGPVVNVVIDEPALSRGHLHPGERSHIVGGGPIPPRVVRGLLGDAFLKIVLTDGVDVQKIAHVGRRRPAELRTALELGPAPEFDGVTCSETGCERRYSLEWDHKDPVANHGITSLENVQPLCLPHHWDKTERDRAAGLFGSGTRAGRVNRPGNREGRAPP